MTQATLSQEIEMIEKAIMAMQNGEVTKEQANNFASHIAQMQNKNAKAVGLQFTKMRFDGIKNNRPVYRMLEVTEVIELAKKLLAA